MPVLRGPVEYRRRLTPRLAPPLPKRGGRGAVLSGLVLLCFGAGLAGLIGSGASLDRTTFWRMAFWTDTPKKTTVAAQPSNEIVRLTDFSGEMRSHATGVLEGLDPADDATGAIPPEAGLGPATRPAQPPAARDKRAEVAIIVDDLGLDPRRTDAVIALDGPLTLSFLPYGRLSRALARQAGEAGHEVMLHLPMEPLGTEDPGPGALTGAHSPGELRTRVNKAVERIGNAVGVNNHMGSALTRNPVAMQVVLETLAGHALFFVDSVTAPGSVATRTAARMGLPAARRDVFLDHEQATGAIEIQLAELERVARDQGHAIAIAHPHWNTIGALEAWLAKAEAGGFSLVPASHIVARRAGAPVQLVRNP